SDQAWRGVLRQLLAKGLVTVDFEGHGTLLLTDDSRSVLKGEVQLMLRREAPAAARAGRSRRPAPAGVELDADSQERFEALRAWRADVAREHGVPAYVIFHDATFREVAPRDPRALEGLSHVHGVGVRKLEAYGEALLGCVAAVQNSSRAPPERAAGGVRPRWRQVVWVAIRPRGVRCRKPVWIRNGSITSSMVSRSSPMAAARLSTPTGPPSNLWMMASSSLRSMRSSPMGSTSSMVSAAEATSASMRPWAFTSA